VKTTATNRFVRLDKGLCARLDESETREWLLSDGLGGYAAGTVAGSPTRRYHGLLLAATTPPAGRTLLVHSVHERIMLGEKTIKLDCNRWADGSIAPRGFEHLAYFELEGRTPTWTWDIEGTRIQRRLAISNGSLEIRWNLAGGDHPVHFQYALLVSNRSHHALLHAPASGNPETNISGETAQVAWPGPPEGGVATPLHIRADGTLMKRDDWWKGFRLAEETARGFEDLEDAWHALDCQAELVPDRDITLHASLDPDALDAKTNLVEKARQEDAAISLAAGAEHSETLKGRLALAADQFIVQRPLPDGGTGATIIAGFPWFADWGRDTMISLPGLALVTGRAEVATSILKTFAAHEHRGLIPNLFPDVGSKPLYNTVDASLFFIEAVRRWFEVTGDKKTLALLWKTVESIITHYTAGTMHGIGMDPADGLIRAGEPGLQLTWMDARIGDRVVTPRRGKPVEINALWHAALHTASGFAGILGKDSSTYDQTAKRVKKSFQRFWNPVYGCLYDVIDGPGGQDGSIRPNQLLAVSLTPAILETERARSVLKVIEKELLVPMGLRTLDPGAGQFVPHYEGSPAERDAAYHQGTAWPWLLGPWVQAQFAVNPDQADRLATNLLAEAGRHLRTSGLGSVSEIIDATSPYTPRGCFAQAWSVAAILDIVARTETNTTRMEDAAGER
jgi:predicted glycogen debranching enzyme